MHVNKKTQSVFSRIIVYCIAKMHWAGKNLQKEQRQQVHALQSITEKILQNHFLLDFQEMKGSRKMR